MCLIMEKHNTFFIFLVILQFSSNNSDKIVGGDFSKYDSDHPFMAAIEADGLICSGTIISRFYVMSACHCIVDCNEEIFPKLYEASFYSILTGSLNRDESRPFSKSVSKVFCSSRARRVRIDEHFLIDHDMAGLRVSSKFEWSKTVRPIELEFYTETMIQNQLIHYARNGTKCIALGWGATFLKCCFKVDYIRPSKNLKQLEVKLIEKCDSYFNLPLLEYNQMCALSANNLGDVCTGDSGGPLICNGYYYGLTSWGTHCGEVPVPTVYQIIDYDFYIQLLTGNITSRAKKVLLFKLYPYIIQLVLIIKDFY